MKRVQIKRTDLSVPVRMPSGACYRSRAVLYDEIGDGPHRCFWCRCEVAWLPKGVAGELQADHLDGETLNDDPANLVAACRRCNTIRGAGVLWLHLQNVAGANHDAVYRYGPIRTVFRGCAHPLEPTNLYKVKGGYVCWTCHREKSRRQWRDAHPNYVARV